jgi:carboxylesterase type B
VRELAAPRRGLANYFPDCSCAADENQGEDCLRLNIWTPGVGDDGRRPMMVRPHGGGFLIGSAAILILAGPSVVSASLTADRAKFTPRRTI